MRIRFEVIRIKNAKVFRRGVIKGEIKDDDRGWGVVVGVGVIKARASVHIKGAKTLYFIPSYNKHFLYDLWS